MTGHRTNVRCPRSSRARRLRLDPVLALAASEKERMELMKAAPYREAAFGARHSLEMADELLGLALSAVKEALDNELKMFGARVERKQTDAHAQHSYRRKGLLARRVLKRGRAREVFQTPRQAEIAAVRVYGTPPRASSYDPLGD